MNNELESFYFLNKEDKLKFIKEYDFSKNKDGFGIEKIIIFFYDFDLVKELLKNKTFDYNMKDGIGLNYVANCFVALADLKTDKKPEKKSKIKFLKKVIKTIINKKDFDINYENFNGETFISSVIYAEKYEGENFISFLKHPRLDFQFVNSKSDYVLVSSVLLSRNKELFDKYFLNSDVVDFNWENSDGENVFSLVIKLGTIEMLNDFVKHYPDLSISLLNDKCLTSISPSDKKNEIVQSLMQKKQLNLIKDSKNKKSTII